MEGAIAFRGATGQSLRERRESLGLDLAAISETLCIRREYLEALEAGEYGTLPGHTYAVGFVRTYARLLGLDGDATVRQFKIEVAGDKPTARLDFPEPLAESRIPTGAIVLVTVLLAAAIYGLWYYLNARDLGFSDIVPEVPGRLLAGSDAPPAAVSGGGDSAPAADGARAAVSAVEEGPAPAAETASPPAGGLASEPVAREPDLPPVPEAPPPGPSGLGAVQNAAGGATPAAIPAAERASQRQDPPPSVAAPVPPPAPPPPREAAAPDSGARVTAPEPAAARPDEPPADPPRIEIRAVSDSWVEVRDKSGDLLMTRIMSPGSSYVVPRQEGLTLVTGNAGGLEILVDGEKVPALGPFGAVRRDVPLDPERLKAGGSAQR